MKVKYLLGSASAAAILAAAAPAAHAGDADLDALMGMNLEEVSNVKISVASKREETVAEAPSVVSVITADDIRLFGGNNLQDLLNRVTSFQFIGAPFVPLGTPTLRGGSIAGATNHVLFLLNGRPIRDSFEASYISGFLFGFPLDAIDKIEIIRGPGSVLYGSNAFNGVVNITTKKAPKPGNNTVSATVGSFGTHGMEGVGGINKSDWDVMVGAKDSASDGWDYNVVDATATPVHFRMDNDNKGAITVISHKGLTINNFVGEVKQNAISYTGVYSGFIQHDKEFNMLTDVGYEHDITDNWKAKYNLTYNNHDYRWYQSFTNDILAEANLQGKVMDKVNLMFGTTYENHDIDSTYSKGSVQWYTGYTQADYKPLDWMKLIAGVQVNKANNIKRAFSPRFGAIVNFDENWGAKLLHGEAFRSPQYSESENSIPGFLLPNPGLQPETITTSEAQLFYHQGRYDAALTYYHSKMEKLIRQFGVPVQFINTGSIDFDGVELEGSAWLDEHFKLVGNATYQVNQDSNGISGSTFTPDIMGKLGIAYDSRTGYTVSAFDNYFGDPTLLRDIVPNVEMNPTAEAYHLMTINATVDVNKALDMKDIMPTTLSLYVDNVLDEDIRFPDMSSYRINSAPVQSGRAFYGRVTVKF